MPLDRDEVEGSRDRQLVEAMGTFLAAFHWQVYATPTFKVPANRHHARQAAQRWIAALGADVYAYIAYEKGEAGGRTHCHALVGGLGAIPTTHSGLNVRALAIKKVGRAWKHGDIKIDSYDSTRGACWYLSKFPSDGEIVGQMKRHRVRHKQK